MVAASARPVSRSRLWEGGRATAQPLRASWNPMSEEPHPPAIERNRPVRTAKRRSAVGWFVHRYGWRAYALPLLVAATVFTVVDIARAPVSATAGGTTPQVVAAVGTTPMVTSVSSGGLDGSSGVVTATGALGVDPLETDPSATVPQPLETAQEQSGTSSGPLAVGQLPPGEAFTVTGEGTYRTVPGTSGPFGASADLRTYTVEIENGITLAAGDSDFAAQVDATLADPRSWISVKDVSLQRVDGTTGRPDFRVTLTSQMTVRGICGFSVQLESSCYSRDLDRVVINDARWMRGALSFSGDLASYRQYAINHEVGHALGYGHQPCGSDGGLAPVMMQQSWSVSDDALNGINGSVRADGKTCKPNPWPDPLGGEGEATATTG